ncbi:MAG TPA: NAD(P)-binding domain-containing protein [Pyrinomonadaceae bacterium]|nr:NAD(P)-binding domain-containing protein [Pyrinomonadaceae bacterium]
MIARLLAVTIPARKESEMNIGIIGAGQIGGTLTRRLTALGHKVFVANSRGPESLAGLARETGATPVTVDEAARNRDIVIVTIPEKNIPKLPGNLFKGVSDDVIVIDTGNYYPQQRDGRIDGIEDGITESRWVSQQLGRRVVKTFNNIYADHLLRLGRPSGTSGRIALPVAGDDREAKARVIELLDELGFDGVDAGTIDESWKQQPGTPVYANDFDADGVKKALSQATKDRKPEWRAAQAKARQP